MAELLHRKPGQVARHSNLRPEAVTLRAGETALHRVVVVGGGAAGLELVTRLGDRLGRRSRASVTLIECGSHFCTRLRRAASIPAHTR
jgi:NADH dehydrogenase